MAVGGHSYFGHLERVLSALKGRYITGLTATPQRRDGRHPISEMQLGPIRFRVDAKSQAARRPFEHKLIVRETGFRVGGDRADIGIQDLYRAIACDEVRNTLVINDVIAAGDSLEEFPKGNSLWRLQGAFMFPSLLRTPHYLPQAVVRVRSLSSVILLCAVAPDSFRFRFPDALFAATIMRSAKSDFMCKDCVTVLSGKNLIGTHRKSDASIPLTRNNSERR